MNEDRCVLVVDDELGPRESLRMILMDEYDVITAENGQQALEELSHYDFDVAILDIKMPDINGIDLLAKLKEKSPSTEVFMITAYASVDSATSAMRYGAMDYIVKPFDSSAVKEAVEKGITRRRNAHALNEKFNELQLVNEALEREVKKAYENIQQHFQETINSLIAAIDAKDSYTKGHQERTTEKAMLLGKKLNLSEHDLELLYQASLLHDIGKIGIPEHVLTKPGPLTEEELRLIRQHPLIGSTIISPVKSLHEVIPLVLHHHERVDGKGYPQGLKGVDIPIQARIIAVVDAMDAMLTHRPYASVKTISQVKEELLACSGTQFDHEVVKAALDLDLPSKNKNELSNKE